jgi:[pyruvate, water dikinase]-phosphate phosphotransferase / [pyruvate, water dikinase] kinase
LTKPALFNIPSRDLPSYFHLHLVSDSTGETLRTISKAAIVQYSEVRAIEHVHPLVRSTKQLSRVLQDIALSPGIVLYTIVNRDLGAELEASCNRLKLPCVPVLDPIMKVFDSYLGAPHKPVVGGQHLLDADYYRRIDALNFTMLHDDGKLPEDLDHADIVLLGISRTSKTPTSIYLANRGYKTANVPIVPGLPFPTQLEQPTTAFIVGLTASAERISQIRRQRVMTLADRELDTYVDRNLIVQEIAYARALCQRNNWPIIDVTRRSIEETAAAIIQLMDERGSVQGGSAGEPLV